MAPQPFTVRLDQAPAYRSLGELLTIGTVAPDPDRIIALAALHGAEVLTDRP
ncbi:hypothetical protein [Modestobacter sp. I12A-02662]|uniref:hypothetical protein n=1 Tax=Modestobacter sp. I12A-02662 TaxID=1730496 RepID=UPI0034DFC28A